MGQYVMIESRAGFGDESSRRYRELAAGLAREGNEVTLFLVENGVLAARARAQPTGLAEAASAGVAVRADEFALRERAIGSDGLAPGITSAPLGNVVEAMGAGAKTMWH
jgi:sulfur relay (sulfurtransferase) complex TusBCD TusD component (DsrE family)